MLSKEKLADIVKDEVENKIRKGGEINTYYYILFDGKIYPQDDYNKEVAEGKRSPNDIYAYVDVWPPSDSDTFLFYVNYLGISSVKNIVEAYLRKAGFTIKCSVVLPPIPNLKYYIDANIKRANYHKPEYLVVNIYDIDSLTRTFHVPQLVEQELGSQPREITEDEFTNIWHTVALMQPLLAGYTYFDAWYILREYFDFHKEDYKNEAYKLTLAYSQLFPTPYRVCYEWKAGIFIETSCLKMVLRRFSS